MENQICDERAAIDGFMEQLITHSVEDLAPILAHDVFRFVRCPI